MTEALFIIVLIAGAVASAVVGITWWFNHKKK